MSTVMGDNKLEFRIDQPELDGDKATSASAGVYLNGELVATIGTGLTTFSHPHPEEDKPIVAPTLSVRALYHGVEVEE